MCCTASRLVVASALAALFRAAIPVDARPEPPTAAVRKLGAAIDRPFVSLAAVSTDNIVGKELIALMWSTGANGDDAEAETPPGVVDDGQSLLTGAAITPEQSIHAAQAAAPGELGQVDLEIADSGIIFVVDVGSNVVTVDAETGQVLSIVAANASEPSDGEE